RGTMRLSSYDRLFPSQDVHTGRGLGNLIAAPLNGKRRQHGTTVFLDPATLEPYDDQWAYLSSIARLSAKGRNRTGPPTARPTVRTRRAPTAVADLFANCSPAGGDHPRHVCLTNHTNRQRPWPSD